jgi:hypothetical protein
MARSRLALDPSLELVEIAAYQKDIELALCLYFSPAAPTFESRFVGKSMREVSDELAIRLDESELRSSLILLTSLEASFRLDFLDRCGRRLKDDLSRYFRKVEKSQGDRVRLDEDILEGWKQNGGVPPALTQQLRDAFKFRHWLAHGRYWPPKLGRKQYDFAFVSLMAATVVSVCGFEA